MFKGPIALACVAGGISLVGALAAEPLAPRELALPILLAVYGFLPSPRVRNISTHARNSNSYAGYDSTHSTLQSFVIVLK